MNNEKLKLYARLKLIDFQYETIGNIRNKMSFTFILIQWLTLVIGMILRIFIHEPAITYTSTIIVLIMLILTFINSHVSNKEQKIAAKKRVEISAIMEALDNED